MVLEEKSTRYVDVTFLQNVGVFGSIALTLAACGSVFFMRGPIPYQRSHLAYRWMFAFSSLLLTLSWGPEPFMMLQRVAPRFVLGIWERWLFASLFLIPVLPVVEVILMHKNRSKENDRALILDSALGIAYLAFMGFVLIRALPGLAVD